MNHNDLKIDYKRGPGYNVTITHLPTGLQETAKETRQSIDDALARLDAKLALDSMDDAIHIESLDESGISLCGQKNRRNLVPWEGQERDVDGSWCWTCLDISKNKKKITPYYGDPGDEQDVSRWEGEGGQ